MYGKFTFIIAIFSIICGSCSPHQRFVKLVSKHPYLLDPYTETEISYREGSLVDTILVLQDKSDTIYFSQNFIERRNDTFRIYFKERNCTTYVQKTEIKPSKTTERYFREKEEKQQAWQFFKVNFYWIVFLFTSVVFLLTRRR